MPIYKMDGRKDGKQKYKVVVNYYDVTGKKKQLNRVVYGMDDAKTVEQQLRLKLQEAANLGNAPATVQALFDEYIAAKKFEVRETTLKKSQEVLEHHVLPLLGTVKLKKLNIAILQKWKIAIANKGFLIKTQQNIYKELRAMLNYAVKLEYIPSNPLLKVGNFKSTLDAEEKHNIDFYTAEEFQKFILAAESCAAEAELKGSLYEWNYYVFFAIAFYTGLRKGEINGLQWNDIDGEYLSVRRSIAQKLKGEDRVTAPKNKSSIRTLQIPKPLIDILTAQRNRHKKLGIYSDSGKICGADKALRDTTIQHRNSKYAGIAGIKTIRIHDFRHSHATLLANEGINVQEISRRLGHSNVEITWNTYSHLYPREEERAVQILDRISCKA